MALLLFPFGCVSRGRFAPSPSPIHLQWKRLVPGIVGGALVQSDALVFVGTTGRVLAVDRMEDGLFYRARLATARD